MFPGHLLEITGIARFVGITELKTFDLSNIYEGFDIETFLTFMKVSPSQVDF